MEDPVGPPDRATHESTAISTAIPMAQVTTVNERLPGEEGDDFGSNSSSKAYHQLAQNDPESYSRNAQARRPRNYTETGTSRKWWPFELLATFLSTASFLSLIVVLRKFDGSSHTTWRRGLLTLNGLVAILSTVTRTALMVPVAEALSQMKWNWFSGSRRTARPLADLEAFDQASRGAFGSLKLLWAIRIL